MMRGRVGHALAIGSPRRHFARALSSSRHYEPLAVEHKWQQRWEEHQTFKAERRPGKKKKYVLDMFPYPSGDGLHVGHPLGYTASDIMARYWRLQDYDVLHPMGWDAFGLPAEQHAILTGTPPRETTIKNIANFKRQLKRLGFSYDWNRELATTDEGYVKWTQWIFLQLFNKGLAFQSEKEVNWCETLGTVLANEEVIDGLSERGSHPVQRLPLRQWVLAITEYADQLEKGLDEAVAGLDAADAGASASLDWPTGTLVSQRKWIGRQEGVMIDFPIDGRAHQLKVFTTRADTLMGVTYVAMAPEHPLAGEIANDERRGAVEDYINLTRSQGVAQRRAAGEGANSKTGVDTGAHVVHPLTGEKLPIWVADYVLADYGTGAVMAVPAHDQRDLDFARTHQLPVRQVVQPLPRKQGKGKSKGKKGKDGGSEGGVGDEDVTAVAARALWEGVAFTDDGACVNSGEGLDGLCRTECEAEMVQRLEAKTRLSGGADGGGKRAVAHRLRDWIFSRQRYWGEPIPIYYPVDPYVADSSTGGESFDPRRGHPHTIRYDLPIPVQDDELPLRLPNLGPSDYAPVAGVDSSSTSSRDSNSSSGEGSDSCGVRGALNVSSADGCLARAVDWRYFQKDGKWYARETNTMPQWAGSCWYYLRFADPHNSEAAWSKDAESSWLPVDLYVGGSEHAVLHLLYARFWHKALFDIGLVSHSEPFLKLVHQGMILGADGEKMSKSRDNVVSPDAVIDVYGADAMRMYSMFMGPLDAVKPWQTEQMQGVVRFAAKLAALTQCAAAATAEAGGVEQELDEDTTRLLHRTIKKVTADLDEMSFNTAISQMMVLSNHLASLPTPPAYAMRCLAVMVAPFAPHLAEEMWEQLGGEQSAEGGTAVMSWLGYDEVWCVDDEITIGVQVNGKVRGDVTLAKDASEEQARELAMALESVTRFTEGKEIKRFVYVPGKIVNIVVK